MIPGAILTFAGTDYTVPPINLRIGFAYKDQLEAVCKPEGEVPFSEYAEAAGSILFALFQRNYPDMTRDAFNDMIDLPVLRPIMNGMLHISGYVARPLEVTASQAQAPQAEPSSSDSSTPPPDGSLTTSLND